MVEEDRGGKGRGQVESWIHKKKQKMRMEGKEKREHRGLRSGVHGVVKHCE